VANEIASYQEDQEHDSEIVESSPHRRRRRGPARAGATRQQHRRIRFIYFSLASTVGFVIGSTTVIGGQALFDPTIPSGLGRALLLLAAAAFSVAAGVFVARLYRGALGRKGLRVGAGKRGS
jgi:hypothetical protein